MLEGMANQIFAFDSLFETWGSKYRRLPPDRVILGSVQEGKPY